MKLFLTSSVSMCAKEVARDIGQPGLKLVFIDTAAEVEVGDKSWLDDDRNALVEAGFQVSDYTISDKNKEELVRDLNDFDVIYVSGGNTFYLLQQAQISGFVDVIRKLVIHQNKIYVGTSAGSIIAGPDIFPVHRIDKVSAAPLIKSFKGFGLVNFCIFPHWGSEHFKELYLNQRLENSYKEDQVPIVVLTDHQYILVEDDMWKIMEVKNDK